jgi:hypothetical protein
VNSETPASGIRSLIGLNANVTIGGRVFHVQTEDLGLRRACIVTHVFANGGQVVRKARFDYTKYLGRSNLENLIPKAMQAQHAGAIQHLHTHGGEPVSNITGTDLPVVTDGKEATETKQGAPVQDAQTSDTSQPIRLGGTWTKIVAGANEAEEREPAATPAIPLSDGGSSPATESPPHAEVLEPGVAAATRRSTLWGWLCNLFRRTA